MIIKEIEKIIFATVNANDFDEYEIPYEKIYQLHQA